MPTIGREDLRLSSYYGWRARGQRRVGDPRPRPDGQPGRRLQPGLRPRRQGHQHDREPARAPSGSSPSSQKIYRDYAWKTLSYADFRRELIAFDPSVDWGDFLDGWLIEHRDLDWSVEAVEVGHRGRVGPEAPGHDPAPPEGDVDRADGRDVQGRRPGASGADLARSRLLRRPRCPRRAARGSVGRVGPVARAVRRRSRSTPTTPCSTRCRTTTAGSRRSPGGSPR